MRIPTTLPVAVVKDADRMHPPLGRGGETMRFVSLGDFTVAENSPTERRCDAS